MANSEVPAWNVAFRDAVEAVHSAAKAFRADEARTAARARYEAKGGHRLHLRVQPGEVAAAGERVGLNEEKAELGLLEITGGGGCQPTITWPGLSPLLSAPVCSSFPRTGAARASG